MRQSHPFETKKESFSTLDEYKETKLLKANFTYI